MVERVVRWCEKNPGKGYSCMIILFLAIVLSIWVVRSHMEARVFSRITGEQITTWDAMWVQLRVDRPVISTGRQP